MVRTGTDIHRDGETISGDFDPKVIVQQLTGASGMR
jgi:hypothetical protein